jgi:hypothetical protein
MMRRKGSAMNCRSAMNCPYCNEIISLNIVQYYPELLYECECGTVVNDEGEDMTDKYYNPV